VLPGATRPLCPPRYATAADVTNAAYLIYKQQRQDREFYNQGPRNSNCAASPIANTRRVWMDRSDWRSRRHGSRHRSLTQTNLPDISWRWRCGGTVKRRRLLVDSNIWRWMTRCFVVCGGVGNVCQGLFDSLPTGSYTILSQENNMSLDRGKCM